MGLVWWRLVFCVEQRLIDLGDPIIGPDGTFDAWTQLAVATYQSASGLPRDGHVGRDDGLPPRRLAGPEPRPLPVARQLRHWTARRVLPSQQRIWAVDADGAVLKSHRVSGRLHEPYAGTYPVYSRSKYTYSAKDPDVRWRYMVRFA